MDPGNSVDSSSFSCNKHLQFCLDAYISLGRTQPSPPLISVLRYASLGGIFHFRVNEKANVETKSNFRLLMCYISIPIETGTQDER